MADKGDPKLNKDDGLYSVRAVWREAAQMRKLREKNNLIKQQRKIIPHIHK